MPLPDSLPEGAVLLHEAMCASPDRGAGSRPGAADQAAYDALRRVLETCGGGHLLRSQGHPHSAHMGGTSRCGANSTGTTSASWPESSA